MSKRLVGIILLVLVVITISACQPATPIYIELPTKAVTATASPPPTDTETAVSPTSTVGKTDGVPVTGPAMKPAVIMPLPTSLIYDVKSARHAAPYGDSYDLNRLERPFLQDMKYLPDVDIVSFSISEDADWYYVSMQLAGNNPNNQMQIDYGVELDQNADGYGDTLIWAYPPYSTEWTTNWVQVYTDANHDSAGKSSARADTDAGGNGYETLTFDGKSGQGTDPNLAWVRIQEGPQALVQFAFKKSLSGAVFLVGVIADAGPRDVAKMDYNDHFKEAEAGSPLKGTRYYPLKTLFAVDNTCWQAYGMKNPANIAKVCPASLSASVNPQPSETPAGTSTATQYP